MAEVYTPRVAELEGVWRDAYACTDLAVSSAQSSELNMGQEDLFESFGRLEDCYVVFIVSQGKCALKSAYSSTNN